MENDLNNADVNELPDLTSGTPAPAAPVAQEGDPSPAANPNPTPEGAQAPEGQTVPPEGAEGAEPPKPEGEGNEPEGGPQAGSEPDPSTPEGEPSNAGEPSNDAFLSEMSEGRLTNTQDVQGFLNHYDELAEAVKNPELLIPEGKARDAFNYAMQFSGNAAQANQSFHHVMSLDPEKLSAKAVQFEAYMLREENADLINDPARATELFNAEYEEKYGDDPEAMKDNQVLARQHEVESSKAAREIKELQEKFTSETPQTEPAFSQEDLDEHNRVIDRALDGYNGTQFEFADGKGMNFVLNEQQQRLFEDSVRNPNAWMDSLVEQHIDDQGNLDVNGIANRIMLAQNAEAMIELAYNQGVAHATEEHETGIRNPAGTEPGSIEPAAAPKTMEQAWADAMP